jgi:hypothetical protein
MVRTRKKVPMNSAMYLFMPDLLQALDERDVWKALTFRELALYYQPAAQLRSAPRPSTPDKSRTTIS